MSGFLLCPRRRCVQPCVRVSAWVLLLCKHVYVSLCLCARAYLLKFKCLCVFVDVCMSAVTHALLTIGMCLQLSSATAPTMTTRASCTYVSLSPFSCTMRKRQSVADTYTHACNDGSMCWPYVCTHERVCPSVSVCECLYLSLSLSVCLSVFLLSWRWPGGAARAQGRRSVGSHAPGSSSSLSHADGARERGPSSQGKRHTHVAATYYGADRRRVRAHPLLSFVCLCLCVHFSLSLTAFVLSLYSPSLSLSLSLTHTHTHSLSLCGRDIRPPMTPTVTLGRAAYGWPSTWPWVGASVQARRLPLRCT
jgi:hypothetical protein